MKTGNVGIGILPKGSVLNNKLEVNGSINIPLSSNFKINNQPLNSSHLAGTPPVSSKWTNATDVATNIYYNTGNVGIGTISGINNRLEVNGNINIPLSSNYRINNQPLNYSHLAGTLSYNSLIDKPTLFDGNYNSLTNKPTLFDGNYNSLTNKLTAGTNIQILNGVISATAGTSYTLPIASSTVLGGIKVGNLSILGDGTLSLPTASTSVLGGVKVDGSTIVINGSGIIGSVHTQIDWNNNDSSSRAFIANKPVINSQWITSGANIYYNTGNVGIGTATNTAGVLLDVNGVIESRTNIGANNSFYFKGVANSDINRVVVAGQFSTNSAISDTVIRSTNKLVLQSGTAAPSIVIDTGNNVGNWNY